MKSKIVRFFYTVTKEEKSTPNMEALIEILYNYIQNNNVHFDREPTFYKGVLLFSLMGYKKEHKEFKQIISNALSNINCKLQMVEGKS